MIASSAFIHPRALVEPGVSVGAQTRVWGFTHILAGAIIGADCNICEQVFIQNDVVVGDRVTMKCGVQLWDGLRVGDDVFIGPNVTFMNDRVPRSKQYSKTCLQMRIEAGASIGGGGRDPAWPNHWRAGHGGCRQRGDQVGASEGGGGGQPRSGAAPAGGGC